MRLERSCRRAVGHALVAAAAVAALALGAAGCLGSGSDNASSTGATTTTAATTAATTTAPATRTVRIYLVKDGKLAAEGREVPDSPAVGRAALGALLGSGASFDLVIANGVATVTGVGTVSHERAAEIVATLTQFPTVQAVELDGKRLTRLDIEDVTPAILVESPLPGARVAGPLRVTGTANTFEATLQLEVLDRDGNTLTSTFATATSGSGTRGTFDVRIGFDTAGEQPGTLYAYENSAEDGRHVNELRIPLTLLP